MFVVSAKLSRILPYAGLGTLAIIAAVFLVRGEKDAPFTVPGASDVSAPVAVEVSTDSGLLNRSAYLRQYGWIVDTANEKAEALTLPAEFDAEYRALNSLQVTQGFDLLPYAGKTVMRYTYPILNYPGEAEDACAALYVQDGEVIGGTVCPVSGSSEVCGLFYERSDG